jgi:ribulose-5-phosphate 4-epimerase/fuculose-1-phosphate aldolase
VHCRIVNALILSRLNVNLQTLKYWINAAFVGTGRHVTGAFSFEIQEKFERLSEHQWIVANTSGQRENLKSSKALQRTMESKKQEIPLLHHLFSIPNLWTVC